MDHNARIALFYDRYLYEPNIKTADNLILYPSNVWKHMVVTGLDACSSQEFEFTP